MLFNSFTFLIFFTLFFCLYWFVFANNYKLQNILIVAGGCTFYGWWDWRFLFLLIFSTALGFMAARLMSKSPSLQRKKTILTITVLINVGLLFFFKYFNFFIQSWIDLMRIFDMHTDIVMLQIILPIGISFYTFQKLSYVIDVYYGRIEASDDFLQFAAYVSFFPQLLAGPIERATTLLPQFGQKRSFDSRQAIDGLQQIVYGFFKKIVVADGCAMFVNRIWQDYESLPGPTLAIGAALFAFQIYGDFSGYTDIARGCAKLLGFELMINFRYPYFSRSVSEFWRRWHISLSSWFRDYVYFPLGGSRGGKWKTVVNVFVIFLLSGIWHGANWTFVIWGAINAFFILPDVIFNGSKRSDVIAQHTALPSVKEIIQLLFTFSAVCFGWIFFRSDSVGQSMHFLERLFVPGDPFAFFFSTNTFGVVFIITCVAILQLMCTDFYNRKNDAVTFRYSASICVVLIIEVCFMGSYKNHFDFIYFQF